MKADGIVPLLQLLQLLFNPGELSVSDIKKQIWLIRHGETDWSAAGKHTGRTDLPLNVRGEQRAQKLKQFLKGKKFDLVLVSPYKRAQQTCQIAGYASSAETNPDLKEWDYGDFEGKTTAEIREHIRDWTIWTASISHGESLQEVYSRTQRVIKKVNSVNGDVALFAHGHFLRILAAAWLGLSPDCGRLFALNTASVSVLGYEHETPVILKWNEDCFIS